MSEQLPPLVSHESLRIVTVAAQVGRSSFRLSMTCEESSHLVANTKPSYLNKSLSEECSHPSTTVAIVNHFGCCLISSAFYCWKLDIPLSLLPQQLCYTDIVCYSRLADFVLIRWGYTNSSNRGGRFMERRSACQGRDLSGAQLKSHPPL